MPPAAADSGGRAAGLAEAHKMVEAHKALENSRREEAARNMYLNSPRGLYLLFVCVCVCV